MGHCDMKGMANGITDRGFGRFKKFSIRNTTDEPVPKFAILEQVETELNAGSNPVVTFQKMTADGAGTPSKWLYNLLGSIPKSTRDRATGSGTFDTPARVLILASDTVAPGDTVGPIEDKWYVSTTGAGLTVIDYYKGFSENEGTDTLPVDGEECRAVWVRPSQDSTRYFKLLEDVTGTGAFWAERSNRAGDSLGGHIQVYNWAGLLNGALVGYRGQFSRIGGTWDFTQGPCVVPCESNGSITVGDPPDGEVNSPYPGHTVTSSGLTTGLSAGGLPDGLTMDSSGSITGTPTEHGKFFVTVTGSADRIPPPGVCTLTRIMVITVAEEPTP